MIESPCIDICKLDLKSGLCIGCGRTKDEIKAWKDASDAERQAILDQLEERRPIILGLRQTA